MLNRGLQRGLQFYIAGLHSLVSKTQMSPLLCLRRAGLAVPRGLGDLFSFMFADIDGYIREKELPVLEECDVWPGSGFKTEQAGEHEN